MSVAALLMLQSEQGLVPFRSFAVVGPALLKSELPLGVPLFFSEFDLGIGVLGDAPSPRCLH